MNSKQEAAIEKQRQLVCFQLGTENYGLDINYIQDIQQLLKITVLPKAPDFIEGVINLRGKIIPVVDLYRRFFNTSSQSRNEHSRIIILNVDGVEFGVIVDAVTRIIRLPLEKVLPPPELVKALIATQFIEGLTVLEDEEIVVVINPKFLLKEEERYQLEKLDMEVKSNG